jgi:uncharacterized protein
MPLASVSIYNFVVNSKMSKQDIITRLSLVEHREGGYFAETYRSTAIMTTERQGIERNIITSIYYLFISK